MKYDISFFTPELSLINNEVIKGLTVKVLTEAPAYLWTAVSSITGKYHPPEDNEEGGVCLHLKKTAWIAYRMFDNLLLDTDIGVVAGLTHDIAQRGLEDEPSDDIEVYKIHGDLAAQRLLEYKATLPQEGDSLSKEEALWLEVVGCVSSHMGRWGLRIPKSRYAVLFHLADVASSTRGLTGLPFQEGAPNMGIEEIVGRREYFTPTGDGELVFNFGKKHLGEKLSSVFICDRSYLQWMLDQGEASSENPKGFPAYALKPVRDMLEASRQARRELNAPRQEDMFNKLGVYGGQNLDILDPEAFKRS